MGLRKLVDENGKFYSKLRRDKCFVIYDWYDNKFRLFNQSVISDNENMMIDSLCIGKRFPGIFPRMRNMNLRYIQDMYLPTKTYFLHEGQLCNIYYLRIILVAKWLRNSLIYRMYEKWYRCYIAWHKGCVDITSSVLIMNLLISFRLDNWKHCEYRTNICIWNGIRIRDEKTSQFWLHY